MTATTGSTTGVALARSVVALHGGTLRYESEPGKGTTVHATLPGAVAAGPLGAARAAGG